MAKYIVRCYYEYVGLVEVDADSFEDAFDKGYAICNKMSTEELYYCGGTTAEVQHENGGIEQFQIG
jgi:hypothetical protein